MIRYVLPVLLVAPLARAGDSRLEVEALVAKVRVTEADFDLTTTLGRDEFKTADMHAQMAAERLTMILQKQPAAWAWARPGLRDLPRDAARSDLRWRLIELLSLDADPASTKLLAAELRADPKRFPVKAMIRLDRHDVDAATKALETLVGQTPGFANLTAAVHLGLKGNRSALPVLEWARDSGAALRDLNGQAYGTALALKRLGDAKAWDHLRQRAQAMVGKYLQDDDFETARWYAVQLEFYARLAAGKEPIDVLALDNACASYSVPRIAEIDTIEELHELLQRCKA